MKFAALAAIRLYQRFVSPWKGFRCAHRAETGRASCSALGYRAIRRFGLRDGYGVLRLRFDECARSAQRLRRTTRPVRPRLSHRREAGECDVPSCDCDMPSVDLPDCSAFEWISDVLGGLADFASCGHIDSCGGEARKERKRKRKHGNDEEEAAPAESPGE